MKFGISIASQDRFFGKAMRRIRPVFTELENKIEALNLLNPCFETFLILLTDDPADLGEVVYTDAKTLQVMIGLEPYSRSETDDSLLDRSITAMIEGLRLADFKDEEEFQMLFSIFEAHRKFAN